MTLWINKLRLACFLGVYEHERQAKRDVIVSARLDYNADAATRSDLLEDALDYKKVCDRIGNIVSSQSCNLIETLAERIVSELIEDTRISKLQIEVEKPHALELAESVSVTVVWERATL